MSLLDLAVRVLCARSVADSIPGSLGSLYLPRGILRRLITITSARVADCGVQVWR